MVARLVSGGSLGTVGEHALMLYKLLRQCTPNDEFIELNFQANLNRRLQLLENTKLQCWKLYPIEQNVLPQ